METSLSILVLLSALVASLTGSSALRAGLRLRRTQIALRSHLYSEVTRLADRTTELEKNLSALDARAQALPVRISELQQDLATLRVLTKALGASLRQTQRLLSFTDIKSSLAGPLAKAFETRIARNSKPNGHERRIEDSLP
jgi:predicted  nucleic acid-binding Zn-ribbon protein